MSRAPIPTGSMDWIARNVSSTSSRSAPVAFMMSSTDAHAQVAVVVEITHEVLGDRVAAAREDRAQVREQVLREGLLGLGAHDRVAVVVGIVAQHEVQVLERLGIIVVMRRSGGRTAEAGRAHRTGQRIPAQRTDRELLLLERGILFELLVDEVLRLERRALQDVVGRDLLRCDLELKPRHELRAHLHRHGPNLPSLG